MTAALRLAGLDEDEVASSDPGRALITPLLRVQHVFCNHPTSPFSYGALNGRAIPEHLRESYDVPACSEVILASDGYPQVESTLALSEDALRRSLQEDPSRTTRHWRTRGVAPGMLSFDDRAYVRLCTD